MNLKNLVISSFLLGLTGRLSLCCQNAWEFNSNDLTLGTIVTFKNTTVIGKQESLSWIWSGKYSDTWENKFSRSFEDGNMEGTLYYKNTRKGQKVQVSLFWNLHGQSFSSVNSNKEIFNSFWTLNVCQGINMKFLSNKDGSWEFKIDDYVIRKGSTDTTEIANSETQLSREKRSEEEFQLTEGFRNVTIKEGGVFDCIYNFFFGGDNSDAGRSENVFTRIRNWVRGITCRLRGDCEGGVLPSESPNSPPITIPPVNPDAESFDGQIPSSSDNDV